MAKGAYVKGIQGWSLAHAIDGTAPGGASDDQPEPPPTRCRWTGCGTVLSVRNRSKKPPKSKPDIPQDEGTLELVDAVELEKGKRIRRGDAPDDEQLCHVHQRMTLDWHQGFSGQRPAHYPSEEVQDDSARKKKI
jgi:hypothetical protein